MADFVTTHRLTHKACLKMMEAGVTKAETLGCKVSLAVADQSCRLIAFLMMDGARHFSIITTQRKAITSASSSLSTSATRAAPRCGHRQALTLQAHECP